MSGATDPPDALLGGPDPCVGHWWLVEHDGEGDRRQVFNTPADVSVDAVRDARRIVTAAGATQWRLWRIRCVAGGTRSKEATA